MIDLRNKAENATGLDQGPKASVTPISTPVPRGHRKHSTRISESCFIYCIDLFLSHHPLSHSPPSSSSPSVTPSSFYSRSTPLFESLTWAVSCIYNGRHLIEAMFPVKGSIYSSFVGSDKSLSVSSVMFLTVVFTASSSALVLST
jgi:hypothetical protein